MAKNVYMKKNNEVTEEQLKYIEELKRVYTYKVTAIKEEKRNIQSYEELRSKLETIHKKIFYDILIPVSENLNDTLPLCFVNGKVIHTNEVFMPIGTKYYSKLSNTDGINECNRKIEDIKDEIEEFEADQKIILEKLTFLQHTLLQPGQVEIIEEYDDPVEEAQSRSRLPRKSLTPAPKYNQQPGQSKNLLESDFKDGVMRGG